MQYIKFPMKYMNITQGVNGSFSHKGLLAIDNAGKNGGIDNVFAPFDGVIKRIWHGSNTVWLESTSKVKFADGKTDYCTASFTHDNNVTNLKVGQKIKQGQVFYQEGTFGNATGNHVHIDVARGKFTGNGWHQNKYGGWEINNAIHPEKAFFVNGVTIINGFGYKWKKYKEVTMVDAYGCDMVTRFRLGRSVTKAEIAAWTKKYTLKELDRYVLGTKEHKDHLAKIKSTKAVPINNLSQPIRNIFGVK